MYGTMARLIAKPGKREELIEFLRTVPGRPEGYVGRCLYQMDNDSDEFFLAGVFESKEAYFTHSDKPETHQIYLRLLELLVTEPEWHDGHLVHVDFQKRED